jgi:hypothetical protein
MAKSGLKWSKNGKNRSKPVKNMVEMSRYADPFLTVFDYAFIDYIFLMIKL